MASADLSSTNDLNSPMFLLTKICNLILIRRYVLWKFQMMSILKVHKLFGFLDGSSVAPPQFLLSSSSDGSTASSSSDASTRAINPSYEDWMAKDHVLMTLINATLSSEALAYIVGCKSSKDEWEVLARHYSSTSRSNIVNLKTDLQAISKKPDESIDSYVKRIKEIKDKLANVSSVVNEEDLMIYALNGLPVEYNTFRTSMRTRSGTVTFDELHVLLKSEESALEK